MKEGKIYFQSMQVYENLEIGKVIVNRILNFKILGREIKIRVPYNLIRTKKRNIKDWCKKVSG